MNSDLISTIQKLGYTLREASFLYLVGSHSGYFLRRQFDTFIERVDGAIATHFLGKAIQLGHVDALNFSQNRHVYHLISKTIYRFLGNEDSQNRRLKGDEEIQRRLMALDYILENRVRKFLAGEQERVQFFHQGLGIPLASLPHATFVSADGHEQTTRYFVDRLPISIAEQEKGFPVVHLTYIDIGISTIKPFLRFLARHRSLLEALRNFELVYVADSDTNFAAARRQFDRRFQASTSTGRFPHGVEHFISYLRARRMCETNNVPLQLEQISLLRDGSAIYRSPDHEVIYAQWKNGAVREEKLRSEFGAKLTRCSFETHLLRESYPFVKPRYAGRA